jgi:hypothetical protein
MVTRQHQVKEWGVDRAMIGWQLSGVQVDSRSRPGSDIQSIHLKRTFPLSNATSSYVITHTNMVCWLSSKARSRTILTSRWAHKHTR